MGRRQVCCFLSRIGNDKRRWMCVDVDLTLTRTGCMCILPKSRGERERLASAMIVALGRSSKTREAQSWLSLDVKMNSKASTNRSGMLFCNNR
jgi:hypothetical protein